MAEPTSPGSANSTAATISATADKRQVAKVLRAAHSFCQGEELTQEAIADMLGVSQSQVSRLLAEAREQRWLIDRPQFVPPEPGSPFHELWREVESQFVISKRLEDRFRRAFGDPLRRVIVVDGEDEAYFTGAARALLPLLARDPSQPSGVSNLGVTWGRNIRHVIQALPSLTAEPVRARSPLRLVPLCGEPFQDRSDPQSFSSSALVWELHRVLNGPQKENPLSIAGVYAFIPRSFTESEADTIRKFYGLGAGYTTIFGGPTPLVKSLDSILTAVGVASVQHRGIFLAERVHLGDLKESDVASVLGEISGILIPRKKAKPAFRDRLKELNERWTGMKEEDLRECASRPGDGLGVIVAAQAANRAQLIYRCLEEKLINTLLISRVLAEAIATLVESGEPAE
jgi:DNA-binding transcriptional regulator LsrR (DeoR family)